MNQRTIPRQMSGSLNPKIRKLICLVLLVGCSALLAQNPSNTPSEAAGSQIHATHILGFTGVSKNATGNLSVEGDKLQFQKPGGTAAQIGINSIQDVALGTEDKQVGGVPVTLGRAATPFGGGRVIALFSHKKYDTLTLEYADSDGGVHGAIFRVGKGYAQNLKNQLVAQGAHVKTENQSATPTTPEAKK